MTLGALTDHPIPEPGGARDVAVVVVSRNRRDGIRNTLWTTWLRRTAYLLRTVPRDRVTARALADAARGLPWVLRERRVLPPAAEARFAALEQAQRRSTARRYVS